MWAVVTSPGLTTESARRLMSSREARWAANPAASISTEARSCINSRTCSAPLPRSWARDVPIFDRGDVATRVPCGPRPDTRTPWVLSSCRASRMAGLPTPNCSARARSEGIRSPGLTVPVETISLMREATLPGKVVWETGLRCSRATPSSPVPVFFWGLAVPSSAGGVMLLGFLLVLLGRISFPEPEADPLAVTGACHQACNVHEVHVRLHQRFRSHNLTYSWQPGVGYRDCTDVGVDG